MSGSDVGALSQENISGTISPFVAPDKPRRRARPCAYVISTDWHYGAPDPFCDEPTEPGSPYCAAHRALCKSDGARDGDCSASRVPVGVSDRDPALDDDLDLAMPSLADSLADTE